MRQNAASRDTIRVFKSYQPGKAAVLANKAHSLSHTKWMCKYHIVFTPKYRRKLIYSQYRDSLGEIFRNLCRYKGVEIIEGHLMPDHVHMLVSIPPKISVSSFMGYLKGKSALMMFDKHANLKYKFGNRHFWSEGYYVSTVVNANIVSTDWANVPPRPRQPIPANRTNVLSPTAPTELCSPMALPHRDRSDYWMKGTSWAS